jgi:electron transport complex protein RnfA
VNNLLALALFAGLSLNGFLQLGLAVRDIQGEAGRPVYLCLIQWGIILVTALALWVFFALVIFPLGLGFWEWFLLFPLSAAMCRGLEFALDRFFGRFFPALMGTAWFFPARSAYGGLASAAALICLRLALSFADAAALSLGFTCGGFLAALVLNSVIKRSALEAVPPSLRGMPMLLISMGLLALIGSSATAALLRLFTA